MTLENIGQAHPEVKPTGVVNNMFELMPGHWLPDGQVKNWTSTTRI
jgi:hypothetical protein